MHVLYSITQGFDTEDLEEQEARMSSCLDRVDLGYLLTRRGPHSLTLAPCLSAGACVAAKIIT